MICYYFSLNTPHIKGLWIQYALKQVPVVGFFVPANFPWKCYELSELRQWIQLTEHMEVRDILITTRVFVFLV